MRTSTWKRERCLDRSQEVVVVVLVATAALPLISQWNLKEHMKGQMNEWMR